MCSVRRPFQVQDSVLSLEATDGRDTLLGQLGTDPEGFRLRRV